MSGEWDGFLLPKNGRKKKQEKTWQEHQAAGKYCYLSARFYGDYGRKPVQKHT